jgi:hypothetical protein
LARRLQHNLLGVEGVEGVVGVEVVVVEEEVEVNTLEAMDQPQRIRNNYNYRLR